MESSLKGSETLCQGSGAPVAPPLAHEWLPSEDVLHDVDYLVDVLSAGSRSPASSSTSLVTSPVTDPCGAGTPFTGITSDLSSLLFESYFGTNDFFVVPIAEESLKPTSVSPAQQQQQEERPADFLVSNSLSVPPQYGEHCHEESDRLPALSPMKDAIDFTFLSESFWENLPSAIVTAPAVDLTISSPDASLLSFQKAPPPSPSSSLQQAASPAAPSTDVPSTPSDSEPLPSDEEVLVWRGGYQARCFSVAVKMDLGGVDPVTAQSLAARAASGGLVACAALVFADDLSDVDGSQGAADHLATGTAKLALAMVPRKHGRDSTGSRPSLVPLVTLKAVGSSLVAELNNLYINVISRTFSRRLFRICVTIHDRVSRVPVCGVHGLSRPILSKSNPKEIRNSTCPTIPVVLQLLPPSPPPSTGAGLLDTPLIPSVPPSAIPQIPLSLLQVAAGYPSSVPAPTPAPIKFNSSGAGPDSSAGPDPRRQRRLAPALPKKPPMPPVPVTTTPLPPQCLPQVSIQDPCVALFIIRSLYEGGDDRLRAAVRTYFLQELIQPAKIPRQQQARR